MTTFFDTIKRELIITAMALVVFSNLFLSLICPTMPTFRKWHYVIYHGYLLVYRIERV